MTGPVGLAELERIAARGWQGTTTQALGEWLLRAGGGFTGRANSVLAVGESGLPLESALQRIDDFYREHHLPAEFQLPFEPGGQHPLAAALQARGWQLYDLVAFLVTDRMTVDHTAREHPSEVGLPAARFSARPDKTWLSGYHYRGKPLPDNAIAVLVNADQPVFASVSTAEGALMGVARGVVTEGWMGITAVTVQPEFRRLGVGTHLMLELNRWARERGGDRAYLQVDAQNAAALAMYQRLGFTLHHHYSYARRP